MKPITVPLWRAKTSKTIGHLDYYPVTLNSNQRRLSRRIALAPDIDLSAYSVKAVIDFIHVHVTLGRPTQPWIVKKVVDRATGGDCFVQSLDPGAGNQARAFIIKIRDPKIPGVVAACCMIDDRFSLGRKPRLDALEVSVDFTPRRPDPLARAAIVKTLIHSFLPSRDVHEHAVDRPRSVTGKGKPDYLTYWTNRMEPWQAREFRLLSTNDRPAPIDGTFYAGGRQSSCFWRIMDKVLDEQNTFAGTARILEQHERRARIEVSMSSQELETIGLHHLADLRNFSFTSLQGSHFNFYLPTFHGRHETVWDLMEERFDRQRLEKFAGTGVIGLNLYDNARVGQLMEMRANSIRNLRGSGRAVPPKPRAGTGASGTMTAYTKMNRAVSKALEDLNDRAAAAFRLIDKTLGDVWFIND